MSISAERRGGQRYVADGVETILRERVPDEPFVALPKPTSRSLNHNRALQNHTTWTLRLVTVFVAFVTRRVIRKD